MLKIDERYLNSIEVIAEKAKRIREGEEPSTYTEWLLADDNKRIKKISSEVGELIREVCRPDFDQGRFVGEAADVLYALETVVMAEGVEFIEVFDELARRNTAQ